MKFLLKYILIGLILGAISALLIFGGFWKVNAEKWQLKELYRSFPGKMILGKAIGIIILVFTSVTVINISC